MRVLFFGTSAFAVPSLEQLVHSRHVIVQCVTQPDRPRGRGLKREPSPVKQAAERLRVPLSQPERLGSRIDPSTRPGGLARDSAPQAERKVPRALPVGLHEALAPDVGVVAAYGKLIPSELLHVPRHGMLGVHPSLLPKFRGAAPVAWALLQGEQETGVTIFRLNERLDAGEMVHQERVPMSPTEYCDTLTDRLAHLGAHALIRSLDAMEAGQAIFTPQDESQASDAPKLSKSQGRIDWARPAEEIARLIHATRPWPGAVTEWQGESLKILEADATSAGEATPVPGTVLQVNEQAIVVKAGKEALAIRVVQLAGGRQMKVKEFLLGHKMAAGERLG